MISQQYPCSNKEQTPTSPATSNAIRGADQSGNIAKQRYARKGGLEAITWKNGRHDKAIGRYRGIAIERTTSKQR